MRAPGPDGPAPLVLLDLDGTLTESGPGIVGSYRVVLETLGLPVASDEELADVVGPPLTENLLAHGVPAARVAEGIALYRAHYAEVGQYRNRLYPGVVEAMTELRAAGLTLAVATSKVQDRAEEICARFGVDALVDAVFGDLDQDHPTDKATVVGRALATLGPRRVPAPARTRMVGDRRHDVVGAAAHGIATLGAGWGYAPPDELAAAGAERVLASVDELAPAVLAAVGASGRIVA
ncbi:HAD hydrolase-like protein [Cellulomonas marina]|uniref:Phosphoglycolate phosphatase n=1 Tax=Cellulomonas marina TaxID=988821 RepID=A0A1I0VD29_9CELL|nr:HAD hydrolase-like protein [Cellulomonas marina]GIG28039.1 hydrolase [Cellulomonas marina]SFA74172.1 phosphoglycolate phosphatase [Cellulomonas marina]